MISGIIGSLERLMKTHTTVASRNRLLPGSQRKHFRDPCIRRCEQLWQDILEREQRTVPGAHCLIHDWWLNPALLQSTSSFWDRKPALVLTKPRWTRAERYRTYLCFISPSARLPPRLLGPQPVLLLGLRSGPCSCKACRTAMQREHAKEQMHK